MKKIIFILGIVALTGFFSSCHRDACPGVGQIDDQQHEQQANKVDVNEVA